MVALATLDDLKFVAGAVNDEARAARLLEMASATVTTFLGRQLAYVEDDERTIEVLNGILRLPNPPIVDVTSVTDPEGSEVDVASYGLHGNEVRKVASFDWPSLRWRCGLYTVVYSHGYRSIPDDVVKTVCDLVASTLDFDRRTSRTETLGPASVSESFDVSDLTESQMQRLVPYRQQVGSVVVLR